MTSLQIDGGMKMREGYIFINAAFPRDLERRIRVAAATLGISKSEFMRQAAKDFLNRVKQPVPEVKVEVTHALSS